MSTKKACIFPGSFDPVTLGHIDIIKRASKIFDEVTVLILINHKKNYMFSLSERIGFLKECLKDFINVKVDSYDGLLTEYCDRINCYNVIRGTRNGVDFEYEMQYFGVNRLLNQKIDMMFFPTSKELLYVSSGNVRELLSHGKNVDGFVSEKISQKIKEILNNKAQNK